MINMDTWIYNDCMIGIIIINGVVPLRGFPVGRRGIGCRVPILGGRRLAGLVRLVGRARPSRCCQAGMAVQLVGPAPTPHGALGGWQAFAGCGPATGASASAQPSDRIGNHFNYATIY